MALKQAKPPAETRVAAASATPIDYAGLAGTLLARSEYYVSRWLDDGYRSGAEWKARNPVRADRHIGSFGVNLVTGAWADFADADAKGGDLISLYAYLHGLNNAQAARELMRSMRWAGPDDGAGRSAAPSAPKRESRWRAVVPVPSHAPAVTSFRFGYRDEKRGQWVELDAVRAWRYELDGVLYGYVARFERVASDGALVKETIARTWCVDESDGTFRWHWKSWEPPRPLYVPATHLRGPETAVVLVEGEKCALAGHELLGHEFDFVAWPGGAKSWARADWRWIAGRTVYLWPDCDAQRRRLTREEREAGADPQDKALRPAAKQPGMAAMVGIGQLLVAEHGCTVYLCEIPQPGSVADGWDIADAIGEGWDAARVRSFIRGAHAFVPPDEAVRAGAAGAGGGSGGASHNGTGGGGGVEPPDDQWRALLLTTEKGQVKAVRDNVVLALDGLPGRCAGVAEAAGLIAYNEFTNDVVKRASAPWGSLAGAWDESDELEMGNWLTRRHGLPSMPRNTLEEGVLMVAKRHRFHPVRACFEALRGTWDRCERLAGWLRRACMEEDEIDEPTQQYLARVGKWLVMAIIARVLPEVKEGTRTVRGPGTKFDYMVIFEGAQGAKKSTLASVLGWGYAADTGLLIGEKDSYQNLQGVLVYEMSELDSLNRIEVTKVKNFVSSPRDRFRASFDRRAKDYPRQCVFVGTTNEEHYLVDPTGNRRFWPVRVTREIDIAWVSENLSQLFAEGLVYLDAGERFYPSAREQRELFDPQQQQRTVESSIEAEFARLLYDEKQHVPMGALNLSIEERVRLPDLLKRSGYAIEKQTPAVVKAGASALKRLGWHADYRSNEPGRPRYYCRPKDPPAQMKGLAGTAGPQQGPQQAGADSDPPF